MPVALAIAAALAAAPADTTTCGQAAPGSTGQSVTSYGPQCFTASQPNTALDMINRIPGFSFDSGDSVRGFGGAAGNVIIDGARPASKNDPLDEVLKRIPVSRVLRIDVIRGGAPGVDMQGKTVIANVILREDNGLKLTTAGAINFTQEGRIEPTMRLEGSKRFGAALVEWGLLLGKGVDDGSGDGPRVIRSAGGTLLQSGPEHTKGEQVTEKLTGSIKAPLAGGSFSLNATLDREPYRFSQHDVFTFPAPSFSQSEEDHQYRDTAEIGARYERPVGMGLRWETFLLQKWRRNDFFADVVDSSGGDQAFGLRRTTSESVIRSTLKRSFGTTLDIEAGGEGAFNSQNSHTTFTDGGVAVALPAANVRVTETRGEAFGTLTWRGIPKVTIETGVRVEASRISSTGDIVTSRTLFYPKPRAVVSWQATPNDQLRFRVEREVGQLNFDDFAAQAALLGNGVQVGNVTINPERDWLFEATLDHRFWGTGQLSVTVRRFQFQDVIDRAPDPSGQFDSPANIGSGWRNVLIMNLTVPTDKIGLKRGQLSGNFYWRKERVTDPTTHTLREPSGLHPFDWELHYTQGLPALKSTWGFDMFSQWRERYFRFNEIDTTRLKTWVSVFIEYKPRPDTSLRLELQNAGGRGIEFIRKVYSGPRNVSPLDFTDTRDTSYGRMIYVRFRKTWG